MLYFFFFSKYVLDFCLTSVNCIHMMLIVAFPGQGIIIMKISRSRDLFIMVIWYTGKTLIIWNARFLVDWWIRNISLTSAPRIYRRLAVKNGSVIWTIYQSACLVLIPKCVLFFWWSIISNMHYKLFFPTEATLNKHWSNRCRVRKVWNILCRYCCYQSIKDAERKNVIYCSICMKYRHVEWAFQVLLPTRWNPFQQNLNGSASFIHNSYLAGQHWLTTSFLFQEPEPWAR